MAAGGEQRGDPARGPADDAVRRRSLALHQVLRPRLAPASQELEVAARWHPGQQVGGDWYDVVELGAGRLALALGTVQGSGVEVVAAAGQLRTAARTCARLDLAPEEVLTTLDGLVRDAGEGRLRASCAYGVFDPHTRDLCLAVAGQPPPVLRSGSGGVQVLEVDGSSALGADEAHGETRVPLPPGSALALYTAGLLATDDEAVEAGVLRVGAVLAGGPDPLEDLADAVLAGLPEAPDRDRTLLLVRVPQDVAARSTTVTVPVPRDRGRLGEARDRVRRTAADWALVTEIADAAGQIAGELVGNALVHGRGQVELRLRLTRDRLVVEVADEGSHMPRRRRTGAEDERGRGLNLVTALAHRWGARLTDGGKLVWAELDLAAG